MYFIHPDFTTSSPSTWRVVNKHFFLSKISTYAREIKLRYFFLFLPVAQPCIEVPLSDRGVLHRFGKYE